jgi:hypothetical protein
MRLIEEARLLAAEVEGRAAAKKLAEEKTQREWEYQHAVDMLANMKAELKEKVLEAARKGNRSISLSIYSWSSTGRPYWVMYFKGPFENYLNDEGFGFDFQEKIAETRTHTRAMPQDDCGWYVISW